METCVFSKLFQFMNADQLGKTAKELGLDGIDLTVRQKGHVEPAQAKKELPLFKETLAKHGIKISMITTDIVDANNPDSRSVIETAGKLGIRYAKLGYWRYKGFGHYREQEKEVKKALKALEPIFRDNNVRAGFHTHAGACMGLNSNYVLRLIDECDPKVIGVYYDTGHETLEGSLGGWEMDLDIAADRIFMVAVKAINWYQMANKTDGRNGWLIRVVPLDSGMADIGGIFARLQKIKFDGLVSIHSEYEGDFSWRELTGAELVEQTRKDLAYFRGL